MRLVQCFINGMSIERLNDKVINNQFRDLFRYLPDCKLRMNLRPLDYHFHFVTDQRHDVFCKMGVEAFCMADGASSPLILKPMFPTWDESRMAYSIGAFAHDMIYAVSGQSDEKKTIINRSGADSMLEFFWSRSREWHPIIKMGPRIIAAMAVDCIKVFAGGHWGDDNHRVSDKVHISYWTRLSAGVRSEVNY